MSPLNPGAGSSRPTPNVYTGLAFISMAATLATLVYVVLKFMGMGIFS
jgi:hypothetical protein